MKQIPYSKQFIDKQDISSVLKALKSPLITQGPLLSKFERLIAKKVKSKFAVGVNSATSGLHIACLALGLKNNDYLWTVPNSYVSSANCGRFCGANVDFVDIDPLSLNICKNKLKEKLEVAKKKNKLPKILVVVHFGGNPCEMIEIRKLSKLYNFKIIEDASHALGAYYNKNPIGNCKYSEVAVFSFHPVKSITTAEGGMISTNSSDLNYKLGLLRSNGVTRDKSKFIQKNFEAWKYEQHELGYNYRMNEIQAALGISQLKKLSLFNKKRNILAKKYSQNLKDLPIKFQKINKNCYSAYHLFVILFPNSIIRKKLYNKIFNYFLKKKIGVNLHYLPVHLHPFYRKKGFGIGNYPIAENYAKRAISIPLYPSLTFQNQNKVIRVIKKICNHYFNNEKFA